MYRTAGKRFNHDPLTPDLISMKNTLPLLTLFVLITLFIGCKKSENVCALIKEVKITGAKSLYHVGDTIQLGTSITPYALYTWFNSNVPNQISGSDGVFIYPCSKTDEGMYTLVVSNADCSTQIDSVYITVVNDPETAPCTTSTNTVTFSSLPDITFSTNWGIDPSYGCKNLSANAPYGYPDFNIYFNPYWNGIEPEDGPYVISPDFSWSVGPYSVFVASTYESVYFEANADTVYISHNNGKLQANFCQLSMNGSDGFNSFNTTAKGNLTAP
jgi:hypothetical protein